MAADAIPPKSPRYRNAMEIVRDYTLLTVGANFVPIPIINSVAITALQLNMLADLSRHYGVKFDEHRGRSVLTSLGIGFAHHVVTTTSVARAVKLTTASIPLIGRGLAAFGWPAILAGFTWTLGRSYVEHYEAGGRFEDFSNARLLQAPLAALALPIDKI